MYDLKKMAAEFKPGDKVYVLRAADDGENGWNMDWDSDMDNMVGKSSKVKCIERDGIVLEDNYTYPPFVLDKVTCENPFKKCDKVRVRLPHSTSRDLVVEDVDDLFVFEGTRTVRHKYCTLIKSAKTWKLGCQTFEWKGDLFKSKTINITRSQLSAIYEQVNSVFCPSSWEVNHGHLTFVDGFFWCQGQQLGDVDLLKEILEYKEK